MDNCKVGHFYVLEAYLFSTFYLYHVKVNNHGREPQTSCNPDCVTLKCEPVVEH